MTDTTRRACLKALASAPLLPLLSGCATLSPPQPASLRGDREAAARRLRDWIKTEMKVARAGNLSIALLDEQEIIYAEGYGYADRARGIRATANTRYRAGSISKLFTALATMRLAEAGRMDIDAPLQQALPDFAMQSRFAGTGPVTPRGILTHHAGLPSDYTQGMWMRQPQRFSELVKIMRDEYLAFPPGDIYAYSNLGFSLLGAAIEQLSGQPFEAHLQDTLLRPLGMQDSRFAAEPPEGELAALAYDSDGKVGEELPLRDLPAGGLNTTVLDLLQLARLWFGHGRLGDRRLLGEATLAEMQRPQFADQPLDAAEVGLAWHFQSAALKGGGPVLWHSGGTLHHHASLMLLPEQRLAVAVMSSSAPAGELVQAASLKALALLLEARTGLVQPATDAMPAADLRYPPSPDAGLAGFYDTPYGVVRITPTGKHLSVELADKQARLERDETGYFRLGYRLLGLIPADLGDLGRLQFTPARVNGHEVLMARRYERFQLAGTRIEAVPVPIEWRARLGTYQYAGGDAFLAEKIGLITLLESDGFLFADVASEDGRQRIALAPAGPHQAILRGLGRGRGDTVHAGRNNGQDTLRYAGMTFVRGESI